jgi:hypothetical protein
MEAANLFVKCMTCNRVDVATVTSEKFDHYQAGELVQNVWPDEDTWFREIIMGFRTGVYQCESCWKAGGE